MLRKNPGLTLVAVLSLALAIGANATIFSWMEGLVRHPLPLVRDQDRLVLLQTRGPSGAQWATSYPDFTDWRAQARSFTGVAAYREEELGLRTSGQAERAWTYLVSANYFDVLGVRALLGRTFHPDEDRTAGGAPVAVISAALWHRRFAGDSGVVGRKVLVNGHEVTIVGVMPPRFGGCIVGLAYDMWIPLTMQPAFSPSGSFLDTRDWRSLTVFARLKPGVTLPQARAEMRLIGRRQAATYPGDRHTTARAVAFTSEGPPAWLRPVFLALLGITGVVLLIACANVANLLLGRAIGREKEMALRLALGAGRARLVRQLLTESGLLALSGGACGLLLAGWGRRLMAAFVPATPLPVSLELSIGGPVLAFTIAVTLSAALLFGLAPAARASRPDLGPALKEGGERSAAGRSRLRDALVVAQLALSIVALVAAGLFLRGLGRAHLVEPGFGDPAHVLLVRTDLFAAGYTRAYGLPFLDRVLTRTRQLPGVEAASLSEFIPLGFSGLSSAGARVEGYDPQPDENMSIERTAVGPDYFAAMRTRIVRGRGITAADRDGAPPVAVVNETFARRYWPGLDPIGRRLNMESGWMTVVGVAEDGKYHQLDEPPQPFVYRPIAQRYTTTPTLIVRASGDPRTLIEPLRRLFASLDPNLAFLDPLTLEEYVGVAVFIPHMGAVLLSLFGALALIMAAVGIYGVLSYAVSRRAREMGVRIAIGAGRREIEGLVVGQAARLTALGTAIGVLAALGVGHLLRSQLFGIKAYDPPTFVTIVVLLGAVALVASWIPARRAARVDPVVALKSE
jgi:predicted permease